MPARDLHVGYECGDSEFLIQCDGAADYGAVCGLLTDQLFCEPGGHGHVLCGDVFVPSGGRSGGEAVADQRSLYGGGTYSGNLDVDYTFDAAGRIANTTVPFLTAGSGATEPTVPYYTGYDLMGRPSWMNENDALNAANGVNTQWVQNVAYDYAGRRTSLQRYLTSDGMGDDEYTTETMSYNVNGPLASLNWSGVNGGVTYTYSATQNNGQITQMTDSMSCETISYEYDSLKRLTLAVASPTGGGSPAWTQGYTYDEFGNLTAKVLNGASTPIPVTAASNRLASSSYDSWEYADRLGNTYT